MKQIQIFIFSAMMIASFACKSNKDTTAKSNGDNTATQNPAPKSNSSQTTPVAVEANKFQNDTIPAVYRVAVSFFSIGEGTDPDGRPMLDSYVQQFMDASSKRIAYDAHPWGREGENDICFTLDNLSPEEQMRFINGLNEVFKGRELVRITENKENNYRK